jgi:hypothetical protein
LQKEAPSRPFRVSLDGEDVTGFVKGSPPPSNAYVNPYP